MVSSFDSASPLKYFFVAFKQPVDRAALPCSMVLDQVETVHYMGTVCRVKPGQDIVLVNADEQKAYRATIQKVSRKSVMVEVRALLTRKDSTGTHLPAVTLVASIIKETPWSWMLQKATELGVSTIQPVFSERTTALLEPGSFAKKQKRWQSIVQSAAEQSEGLFLPSVELPVSISDWLSAAALEKSHCCFLHERGENRVPLNTFLKTRLHTKGVGKPFVVAIGPEGGWSDEEAMAFRQKNITPIRLGERILRAETASLLALGAILLSAEVEDVSGQISS